MGTEIKIVLQFKALENGVLQLASFLRKVFIQRLCGFELHKVT